MDIQKRIVKIEKQINKKMNKKNIVFPILGGTSFNENCREITEEEVSLLKAMGIPIPIFISRKQEKDLKKLIFDFKNSL